MKFQKNFTKVDFLINGNKFDILSKKIKKREIVAKYLQHGIILFKNFATDPNKFNEFIKNFTLNYSNDAIRRKLRFGNPNLRDVDSGNHQIELHSSQVLQLLVQK